MSKILRLYNTFARTVNDVELAGKLISAGHTETRIGSMYICGPTVYSDSHMGHALTYVRADLFRRIMKSIFNVRLITVMNITDIDDKILAKSQEELTIGRHCDGIADVKSLARQPDEFSSQECGSRVSESRSDLHNTTDPDKHHFQRVADKYFRAFVNDMEFIRVQPADLTIKVTKRIKVIIDYIKRLEREKHAYIAENGDIYFRVASLDSYKGRIDERKRVAESPSKRDIRDFVLWKAAKPNEPVWMYKSDITGECVAGRPGWHVQCSAIASSVFGRSLDFHYGGQDLVFPHHYNEEACCCAFHKLDTSKSLHVWSNNWLHSGHLILRKEKMSKSLGNVIAIKSFINDSSVNALRLLCVTSHYRSNVEFSQDLLDNLMELDHKLKAFTSYINEEIIRNENGDYLETDGAGADKSGEGCDGDISLSIHETQQAILEGACDDLDLDRGLQSILDLSRKVYSKGSGRISAKDLVSVWFLLKDWCQLCGLQYGLLESKQENSLLDLVQTYRQRVRSLTVDQLKNKQPDESGRQIFLKSLLTECDSMRAKLDNLGLVIRDKKT